DAVKLQGVTLEDGIYAQAHEIGFFDKSARVPVQAADLLMPDAEHGWIGSNTLSRWAVAALEETLHQREPEKPDALRGRVVVFAPCGAPTRMLAPALKEKGAALVVASKERGAAQRAAQTFGGRQIGWEGIYSTIHDVLVVSHDVSVAAEEAADSDELPVHPG